MNSIPAAPTTRRLMWPYVTEGDLLPPFTVTIGAAQLFQLSAVMNLAHRIHYDLEWARHEGYPNVVIHAPFHGEVMVQMIRNWMGPSGWLKKISYQNRHYAVLGETLTGSGVITRRYEEGDLFLVDLKLEVSKPGPDGERIVTAPGTATVALPTRAAQVPIPH